MQSSGEVCKNHPPDSWASIWISGAGAGMRSGVSISRNPESLKEGTDGIDYAAPSFQIGSNGGLSEKMGSRDGYEAWQRTPSEMVDRFLRSRF
jgi:hypothetical protein